MMDFGHRLGCHQMCERSFSFKGYQFPVCARCTGVFVGQIVAIFLLINNVYIPMVFILVLIDFMGIDWFLQAIKVKESTNIRRLLTGMCGGVSITYIYCYVFKEVLEKFF